MRKIILVISCLVLLTSCAKKHCYECKFYNWAQSGVSQPSDSTEKCCTDKQIKKFIKDNEDRQNPNDNSIVYAGDKMWVICDRK